MSPVRTGPPPNPSFQRTRQKRRAAELQVVGRVMSGKRIPRSLFLALALASGLLLTACAGSFASYLCACRQYDRLVARTPTTRCEVEARLVIYTHRRISRGQSEWASRRELRAGEYLERYNILGIQPIDVVYDRADLVAAIYPEYE